MVRADEGSHASSGCELDGKRSREGDGQVAVVGNGEPDSEESASEGGDAYGTWRPVVGHAVLEGVHRVIGADEVCRLSCDLSHPRCGGGRRV